MTNMSDYRDTVRSIWIYGSPLLLLLGTVGNTLCFAVMARKRLRNTLFGVYLRCIAVCDTGHLWLGLLVKWGVSCFDFDFSATNPAICKLRELFFHSFGDVAIWAVCGLTVERLFVVLHSNSPKNLPPTRAVITIVCFGVVSVLKNAHMMWTRGIEADVDNQTLSSLCGYSGFPGEHYERFIRPWIVFVFLDLLPVILLLTSNTIIIAKLRRLHTSRPRFASANGHVKNDERHVIQATIMCMTVSFAFIVLITPTMILLVGKPYWATSPDSKPSYYLSKAGANFLIYVHHSINFVLYCLSGQRFREEFLEMVRCRQPFDETQEAAEPLT